MSTTATGPLSDEDTWRAYTGPVERLGDGFDLRGLHGRRAALVGDPARVVRAVAPAADHALGLKVFQTDGAWVLPDLGPIAAILGPLLPRTMRLRATELIAGGHRHRGVHDAWTRRHLTPVDPPTPDRIVRSNRYYRALRRPNVDLIGWPIAGVVGRGIRTADGIEHHVDVIVVA